MARFRKQRGKTLGGEPPRRRGQRWRSRGLPANPPAVSTLVVLVFGVLVVLLVGGYAWLLDRELRAGILQQRTEAANRPDWVPLRELPMHVPYAFVTVVEPALLTGSGTRTPREGPSLAGELVRQVHLLPPSIRGESKARLMAPVLELRLGMVELLELYLNRIYLGESRGVDLFGIEHASQEYFGRDPQELTLSQAATLAGLLLEPQIHNPRDRVGAVGARRNEVLQVMLLAELISAAEYRQAIDEPLGFQPGLEQMPMTRPLDWITPREPLRLPPERRPSLADSAQSRS